MEEKEMKIVEPERELKVVEPERELKVVEPVKEKTSEPVKEEKPDQASTQVNQTPMKKEESTENPSTNDVQTE